MAILAKPFKKLFGGGSRPAPQQPEKPDPLMPDIDALKLAARRKAAMRRGGRASTILSDRLGP